MAYFSTGSHLVTQPHGDLGNLDEGEHVILRRPLLIDGRKIIY